MSLVMSYYVQMKGSLPKISNLNRIESLELASSLQGSRGYSQVLNDTLRKSDAFQGHLSWFWQQVSHEIKQDGGDFKCKETQRDLCKPGFTPTNFH